MDFTKIERTLTTDFVDWLNDMSMISHNLFHFFSLVVVVIVPLQQRQWIWIHRVCPAVLGCCQAIKSKTNLHSLNARLNRFILKSCVMFQFWADRTHVVIHSKWMAPIDLFIRWMSNICQNTKIIFDSKQLKFVAHSHSSINNRVFKINSIHFTRQFFGPFAELEHLINQSNRCNCNSI